VNQLGTGEQRQQQEEKGQTDLKLPERFEWCFDEEGGCDDVLFEQVYHLLLDRDEDSSSIFPEFRFDPKKEVSFYFWSETEMQKKSLRLMIGRELPKGHRCFLAGFRNKEDKKLMGFVAAWNLPLRVNDSLVHAVDANSLIVHPSIRNQGLASVLMKEIIRKCAVGGFFQAIHTSAYPLPFRPISVCKYWNRPLNIKVRFSSSSHDTLGGVSNLCFETKKIQKLIECKFYCLKEFTTLTESILKYEIASTPLLKGLRLLKREDISAVNQLMSQYLKKFQLAPVFSDEELETKLLPNVKEQFIWSYVVEKDGVVTDLVSFYVLEGSGTIGSTKFPLKGAYLFYAIPGSNTLESLIMDCLILAKSLNCDVFSFLDHMENKTVVEKLLFFPDEANQIYYHLFNWKCPFIPPQKVGLAFW
jgi:glycylpeptide N-tetradecanoyltransferase